MGFSAKESKLLKEGKAPIDRHIQTISNDLIRSGKELANVAKLSIGEAKDINISDLVPFSKHTYEINQEKVEEYAKSIKDYGLNTPIIVREQKGGKYEILAGHHRTEACKKLGYTTISAIVKKNVSDDEAVAIVHQTNMMQKSFANLPIYEKASSIWQMREARRNLEHTKPELQSYEEEVANEDAVFEKKSRRKKDSVRTISLEFGIAKTEVQMLLRLYETFKRSNFKYLEDSKEKKKLFDLTTGYMLCSLKKESLDILFKFLEEAPVKKISRGQAKELIEADKNEVLNNDILNKILIYAEMNKPKMLSLKERFKMYIIDDKSEEELEEEISKYLEEKYGKKEEG